MCISRMGKHKAERDVNGPIQYKDREVWISKYEILGVQAIECAGYTVNASGLPMQRCVKCREMKERTTEFFNAETSNFVGNWNGWFDRSFPKLHNSASYPCRTCWASMLRVRNGDVDGDGWLRCMTDNYKHLTIDWARPFYNMPDGVQRCWATGGTLHFQKGSNAFSISVNGITLQTGKYNVNNGHSAKDVVPVYAFANCTQTVRGPACTKVAVIPSLRKAYAEVYVQVISAFRMGRAELEKRGDAAAMKMKAWKDFGGISMRAKNYDLLKKLNNDMPPGLVLNIVRSQHAICNTTGIILTTFSSSGGVRGPFDVHMDRINDASSPVPEGHVPTNLELKCRLLNNRRHITRKDFLLLFLNQVLVPVPEDVRQLALAEYDAIPRSPRDAWKHSSVEQECDEIGDVLAVLRHVQAAKAHHETAWFSSTVNAVFDQFPGAMTFAHYTGGVSPPACKYNIQYMILKCSIIRQVCAFSSMQHDWAKCTIFQPAIIFQPSAVYRLTGSSRFTWNAEDVSYHLRMPRRLWCRASSFSRATLELTGQAGGRGSRWSWQSGLCTRNG